MLSAVLTLNRQRDGCLEIDIFDAQGRVVATAAQRVQDLVNRVVDLLGAGRLARSCRSSP